MHKPRDFFSIHNFNIWCMGLGFPPPKKATWFMHETKIRLFRKFIRVRKIVETDFSCIAVPQNCLQLLLLTSHFSTNKLSFHGSQLDRARDVFNTQPHRQTLRVIVFVHRKRSCRRRVCISFGISPLFRAEVSSWVSGRASKVA